MLMGSYAAVSMTAVAGSAVSGGRCSETEEEEEEEEELAGSATTCDRLLETAGSV